MPNSDTPPSSPSVADAINDTCPWSGDPIDAQSLTIWHDSSGTAHVVGFCNTGCRDKFAKALDHFAKAAKDCGHE